MRYILSISVNGSFVDNTITLHGCIEKDHFNLPPLCATFSFSARVILVGPLVWRDLLKDNSIRKLVIWLASVHKTWWTATSLGAQGAGPAGHSTTSTKMEASTPMPVTPT